MDIQSLHGLGIARAIDLAISTLSWFSILVEYIALLSVDLGRGLPSYNLSGSRHWRDRGNWRRNVCIAALIGAVASGVLFIAWRSASLLFLLPGSKGGDFMQDYLSARALVDGVNPYIPIDRLALRYLPGSERLGVTASYPTPHPPPVILLFLPFAFLDHPTALAVWFVTALVCLAATTHLLGQIIIKQLPIIGSLAITAAVLCWYPARQELSLGQVMILTLLLIVAARWALLSDRPILGGILLGFAVMIKFITWPLLLLFVLRRDWRVLLPALSTIFVVYLVASYAIGFSTMVTYFTEVLPADDALFHSEVHNLSVSGLAWRIFEGTGPGIITGGITAPPLIQSPVSAVIVTYFGSLLLLITAGTWIYRQRNLDLSIGVMICISLLISPVCWDSYLVLLAIPAVQLLNSLKFRGFPAKETRLIILLAAPVLLLLEDWSKLAIIFPSTTPVLAMVPTLSIAALAWFLTRQTSAQAFNSPKQIQEPSDIVWS